MPTIDEIKNYVVSTHSDDSTEKLQFILDAIVRQKSACLEQHKLVLQGWEEALTDLLTHGT